MELSEIDAGHPHCIVISHKSFNRRTLVLSCASSDGTHQWMEKLQSARVMYVHTTIYCILID